jgi:hypothetical protein
MSLLIFALVALLVLALVIWAIDMLPVGDARVRNLIKVVAVVIAALAILQRSGIVGG